MILRILFLFLAVAACTRPAPEPIPLLLTVMTFNTWGAGANEGKSIDATVAVLRKANADIVGLQEVRRESTACSAENCSPSGPSVAPAIAAAMGYFVYEQGQQNEALWANAVLSRYPITGHTSNDLGVIIEIDQKKVVLFNIHLADYPYQPYQLLQIPYDAAPFLATEEEAIAAAAAARGAAARLLIEDLDEVSNADAVFVVGDFNEPSHRDWTSRAAAIGRHPISVRFPTAQRIEAEGFDDAYRSVFADEIAAPGYTWTPTSLPDDAGDHHDRIDYVFVRGANIAIQSAAVVGEDSAASDIVVMPWPSDHRAVVASVSIP